MHFLAVCRDVADSGPIRAGSLLAHQAYVDDRAAAIVYAGPLSGDNGDTHGQVAVLELPDLAAAHDFLAQDPFSLAGVFASVQITRVIPKFLGGERWPIA